MNVVVSFSSPAPHTPTASQPPSLSVCLCPPSLHGCLSHPPSMAALAALPPWLPYPPCLNACLTLPPSMPALPTLRRLPSLRPSMSALPTTLPQCLPYPSHPSLNACLNLYCAAPSVLANLFVRILLSLGTDLGVRFPSLIFFSITLVVSVAFCSL